MGYFRRILPNPKQNEELVWVEIDVPDSFFSFDDSDTTRRRTPVEQWMLKHIGFRARSLDHLRCYDYFDWTVALVKFLDVKHSRYKIHFRDPDHAMLFKLKFDMNDFIG